MLELIENAIRFSQNHTLNTTSYGNMTEMQLDQLFMLRDFSWQLYEGYCKYLSFVLVHYIFSAILIAMSCCGLIKESWCLLAPFIIVTLIDLVIFSVVAFVFVVLTLLKNWLLALVYVVWMLPSLLIYCYIFSVQYRCGQYFKEKREFYSNNHPPAPNYIPSPPDGQAPPYHPPLPPINHK